MQGVSKFSGQTFPVCSAGKNKTKALRTIMPIQKYQLLFNIIIILIIDNK